MKHAVPPLLTLLLLAVAGCGGGSSPTEPVPPGPPGEAYTFSEIRALFFEPTCSQAGCHSAATASAGLVLEGDVAYANLVGAPSTERPDLNRVEPGDPERSYMVKKLRGDGDIVGARMPFGLPPLSQEDIDGIVGWVEAGAPRN